MQQFRNLTTMEDDFRYLGLVPNNDGNSSLVRDISESIGEHNSLVESMNKISEDKSNDLNKIRSMTKEAMKKRLAGNIQDALTLEKARDRLIDKCHQMGYGDDAEDAATETESENVPSTTEATEHGFKVGDHVSFIDFQGKYSVGIIHSIEDDGYAIRADSGGNVLFSKNAEKISKEEFENFIKAIKP